VVCNIFLCGQGLLENRYFDNFDNDVLSKFKINLKNRKSIADIGLKLAKISCHPWSSILIFDMMTSCILYSTVVICFFYQHIAQQTTK
jgi:hypothetical protein